MKKYAKLFLAVFMVFALVAFIAGCAQQGTKPPGDNGQEEPEEETVTLVFATVAQTGSYFIDAMNDALIKVAKEESEGTLIIEVYPDAQLGGEREQMEGIQLGNIDMCAVTEGMTSNFIPEFGALVMPFLVDKADVYTEFVNSSIGQDLLAAGEASGFKVLGSGIIGFRIVTNNVRPITKPDDFKGINMRTMQVPNHMDAMQAMGANVVSVPAPEIYTALQTGVADGQMNEYAAVYLWNLYEVQKYITDLPVFTSLHNFIIGMDVWNNLSPKHQQALEKAVKACVEYEVGAADEQEAGYLQDILDTGQAEWNKVDEITPFREAVEPMYEKYLKENPDWKPIVDWFKERW